MATKNKKLTQKSSKKSREEGFKIEIHFNSLEEEALDILASMLCEYLKESKHHEK